MQYGHAVEDRPDYAQEVRRTETHRDEKPRSLSVTRDLCEGGTENHVRLKDKILFSLTREFRIDGSFIN